MGMYTPKAFVPKPDMEQAFNLKGRDGISDAQITEHLALYAGSVKQVNTLNQELAAMLGRGHASGRNPEFAELTRRLGFEYNGMILHESYFADLRPPADPGMAATSGLAQALTLSFGSVEQWRADFQAVGEMRGVGWVILFQDPATDHLTNHWITLHQDGIPAGFKPLLVVDVWEHAFMRDYKAPERGRDIEASFGTSTGGSWSADSRRKAPFGPPPDSSVDRRQGFQDDSSCLLGSSYMPCSPGCRASRAFEGPRIGEGVGPLHNARAHLNAIGDSRSAGGGPPPRVTRVPASRRPQRHVIGRTHRNRRKKG